MSLSSRCFLIGPKGTAIGKTKTADSNKNSASLHLSTNPCMKRFLMTPNLKTKVAIMNNILYITFSPYF